MSDPRKKVTTETLFLRVSDWAVSLTIDEDGEETLHISTDVYADGGLRHEALHIPPYRLKELAEILGFVIEIVDK